MRSLPISTIMKKSGRIALEHPACDGEPAAGHLVDIVQDARLVGAAEIGDVEDVILTTEPCGDLVLK